MGRHSFHVTFHLRRRDVKDRSYETEAFYTMVESRRQEAFSRSMYEQQKEYTQEEQAQWEPESLRVAEFDRCMGELSLTFDSNEERRIQSFKDTEKKLEKICRKSEKIREKMFLDAQTMREAAFRRVQGSWEGRSEWYRANRDEHVQLGRQARKEVCDRLEKDLLEQFHKLLQVQEESFLSAEHRRAETVAKLLDEEIKTKSNAGDELTHDNDIHIGTAEVEHNASRLPFLPWTPQPVILPHRDSSSSRSHSPTPSYDSSGSDSRRHSDGCNVPISVVLPEDIWSLNMVRREGSLDNMPFTQRVPCRSVSPDVSIHSEFPPSHSTVRIPIANSSVISEKYGSGSTRDNPAGNPTGATRRNTVSNRLLSFFATTFMNPTSFHSQAGDSPAGKKERENAANRKHLPADENLLEERFRSAQDERRQAFTFEEENRKRSFNEAEVARDRAESIRSEFFQQHDEAHETKFLVMMEMQEYQLEYRELHWNRQEDRRNQQCQSEQDHRSQTSDELLSCLRKQWEASDYLEAKLTAVAKHKIERQDKAQRQLLREARDGRADRFRQSQKCREEKLRRPWIPDDRGRIRGMMPPCVGASVLLPCAEVGGSHIHSAVQQLYPFLSPMMPLTSRQPWTRTSSGSRPLRSISPDSNSAVQLMSPVIGIDPRVILQATNLTEPLPVPGVGVQERLSLEQVYYDLRREHQAMFRRSQDQREKVLETRILKRRVIFQVSEARRLRSFEENQRERRRSSSEKEWKRELAFRVAQKARWRHFLDGERNREETFNAAERLRDTAFKVVQQKWGDLFHSTQQQLQDQCFESERCRLSDIEDWASNLLFEREREITAAYKSEEESRERDFQRLLERSESRGCKA
ncbi:hypothetical protein Hypma_010994 [Hypsizygus marmoreus]|uniref:Uncharacterized protein n=1 Tax=Hypsizygus marmoreus TaxID=39966 RepID=A0A369JIJ2_HYPMA|nr:hypothetical protein Hypma_010994 [Hypsizygus marmoreus]